MIRDRIPTGLGFASALVIAASALIAYFPSLRIGFLGDDWWFLGKAALLNLPDYLAFYFDPAQQIFWYRPLYGVLLLIEYWLFRASPEGYHVGQILLHAANGVLLFAIVWRLSRRARLAVIAALFYATVAVHSSAVFWIAVQDPLALVFYLAAIWFWIDYLQTRRAIAYTLTLFAFALTLLSKETTLFLPGILFLIDRLLIGGKVTLKELAMRYAAFAVLLAGYLVIEYRVQTNAYFPNRWGYSLGAHVFLNGARYLALLAFPWGLPEPLNFFFLAIFVAALGVVAINGQWRVLTILAAHALAAILPACFFPTDFFYPRYLYAATISSAVLFAMLVEWFWLRRSNFRVLSRSFAFFRVSFALFVSAVVVLNSAQTIDAGLMAAEEGRQARVPLRDIYQAHPTFPPDTYLYLVEFPYPYIMRNLTGMFALRYGSNVTVWSTDAEWGGVDENRFANLREHANSFVYYLDENGNRHEIAVEPSATFAASPPLPLDYQVPIRLEGFEVTNAALKRGSDGAILLYWRAKNAMDKDYTVFVQLVNERGETVLSQDAQPRGGRAPTSKWRVGKLIVDAHILNVPLDLPLGNYRVRVGMYYLPTLERLWFVDANGQPVADQIMIESFKVAE
jgi:hypothetical protein